MATHTDSNGTVYTTPGTGPAPSGTPIIIYGGPSPVSGTLVGGTAVRNP